MYDRIKTALFVIFAAFVALREVTVLDRITGSSIVTAGILLMGLVVIFCDVFINRTCFNNRKTDILFAFLCCTGISCLVNIRYGWSANVKCLCEMVLFFFMLFPSVSSYDRERKTKLLNTVLITVSTLWFILCFISIGMFLFKIEYLIKTESFGIANQGFSSEYSRLWGLFQDPNYAGYVSVATILADIYFFRIAKKKVPVGIGCAINILTQLAYITLSGSRSSEVVLPCALFLYIFYASRTLLSRKKLVLSAATAVASALVCLIIVFANTRMLPLTQKAAQQLPESVQASVTACYDFAYNNSGKELATKEEYIESQKELLGDDFELPDDDEDTTVIVRGDKTKLEGDFSNGRFARWKQTITIWTNSPIIGTSPRNIIAFAKDYYPDSLMARRQIVSHNGFIDVLVSTGIIGIACFLFFFVTVLIDIIRKYFRFENDEAFAITTAIAFTFAISAIFVSDLFFIITIGAFMFWFNLGFAHSMTDGSEKPGLLKKAADKVLGIFDKSARKEKTK